jgi:hypothetical protein
VTTTPPPLTDAQAEQLSEQLRTAGLPPRRTFALYLVVTGGRKPALIPWPVQFDVGSPTAVVGWLAERAAAGELAVPTVQVPVAVGCLVVGQRGPGKGMHLTLLARPEVRPVSGLA